MLRMEIIRRTMNVLSVFRILMMLCYCLVDINLFAAFVYV